MVFPVPISVPSGQLGASTATLFQAQSSPIRVESVTVVNTDVAARTFNLYIVRSGGPTVRITPVNLSLAAGAMYEGSPVHLTQGDTLQGDASVAAKLDYTITALSYVS